MSPTTIEPRSESDIKPASKPRGFGSILSFRKKKTYTVNEREADDLKIVSHPDNEGWLIFKTHFKIHPFPIEICQFWLPGVHFISQLSTEMPVLSSSIIQLIFFVTQSAWYLTISEIRGFFSYKISLSKLYLELGINVKQLICFAFC